MEKVFFSGSWKQYFQRLNLCTFDDFFTYSGGQAVNENNRRNVQKIILEDAGDPKAFFIKRFHNPQLKDVFSAAYRFGRFISQACVEWKNAHYLLENGIDTYKPVCAGQRTRMGIEAESFIVTEELASICLLDFVMEKWRSLDSSVREKIIMALAILVRRIHELNVSFPDLYLWHIFIHQKNPEADYKFSIIDLHRMTWNIRSSRRKFKDLGKIYWSMSPDYFDDEQKTLLINTYLNNKSDSDKASLINILRRCNAKLDRKRKLGNYYFKIPKAGISSAKDKPGL